MRIESTDIWTVVVPTIPGRVHSACYGPAGWDMVPKHIIRIHTDEGIEGIGETGRGTPLESVQEMAARIEGRDPREMAIQHLPAIMGTLDERPERSVLDRWWEGASAGPRDPAYPAFEMAIIDLLGKLYDQPAHWFLGGAARDRVPADYWIGHQTPADAAANTKLAVERGFKGMKMKCTGDEPLVERCRAIWEVAGPEFELTIDPNTRFWRPTEALDMARELVKYGTVKVFEDPMQKWNLDWYRLLREHGVVPVALHLGSPQDIINAIKAEAVDYLNLGGSMVQFVRNAAMAHAAGIPCWHGSGNDLGIMEFSYLHAASAARNCVLGSDFVGSWTREDDLVVEGIQFEDSYALVPDKPGLGCELDMDALERYRVD
ncbi:MAG: mandelate racemase/muconate lactonizing enzyme family protein [Anaerolineae bacterium]